MSPGVMRRLRRRPVIVLAAVIGVIAIVVAGTLWALQPRTVVGASGPDREHVVAVVDDPTVARGADLVPDAAPARASRS